MKTHTLTLLAGLVALSAAANAQYFNHYDITLEDNFQITNILIAEEYEDSGSLTWAFEVGGMGTTRVTNPFPSPALLRGAMIGLAQDLPGDPQGQKHVVLMMHPEAAALSANIAWGTLFRNTLEANLIDDIELATSGQDWPIVLPALERINLFLDTDFSDGILGPGGIPQTGWYDGNGPFTVMAFSDGKQLGTGTIDQEPVPEPASLAALALGVAALRRRKRS